MKKIVIIGANDFQRPLIRKAKEMGYETHVFAWREGATGAADADVFYEISITEKEEILKICKKIKPDAVATIGSDLANITVSYLAEALGLPGNSPACVRKSTNKAAMRAAFKEAGIPVPFFRVVGENSAKVNPPEYPVIVKPTDRSGSRAITKVTEPEQLMKAIQAAIEQSFEKKAIVEGYLEGREYSMETISYQGKHTCLAITRKFTTGSPHFIETGHLEPAPLSEEEERRAVEMIFRGLDALGIQYGASHSELRIDEKGRVRIIEIGSRMGGDCIGSHLVPLSTGEDYVKMVVETAAGQKPSVKMSPCKKYAAIRFIMEETDMEQLAQLHREYPEYIKDEVISETPGSHPVVDSGSRFGYYILQTGTLEELKPFLPRDKEDDGEEI